LLAILVVEYVDAIDIAKTHKGRLSLHKKHKRRRGVQTGADDETTGCNVILSAAFPGSNYGTSGSFNAEQLEACYCLLNNMKIVSAFSNAMFDLWKMQFELLKAESIKEAVKMSLKAVKGAWEKMGKLDDVNMIGGAVAGLAADAARFCWGNLAEAATCTPMLNTCRFECFNAPDGLMMRTLIGDCERSNNIVAQGFQSCAAHCFPTKAGCPGQCRCTDAGTFARAYCYCVIPVGSDDAKHCKSTKKMNGPNAK